MKVVRLNNFFGAEVQGIDLRKLSRKAIYELQRYSDSLAFFAQDIKVDQSREVQQQEKFQLNSL